MKRLIIIFIPILFCNCSLNIHNKNAKTGETVKERILPPEGYTWVKERPGSFSEYLQNLKLKEPGAKILDYKGKPIFNQFEHVAVIDKDIGDKDLQQCADAIIRLRADYLWENNRADEIKFHFTSGSLFRWDDYKNGVRPKITSSNKVSFMKSSLPDSSYTAYRKYLNIIFTYAGTISLNSETDKVNEEKDIKAGDIIVTPGSPGHAVILAGCAKNSKGEKVFLLAEGYTPAQSIHIITNPFNGRIGPWYKLTLAGKTWTARYVFKETNIRSFK